jgi:uncharacterized protein (DUF362 family)
MDLHTLWMDAAGAVNVLQRRDKNLVAAVQPRPRKENVWKDDGQALVARVCPGADLRTGIRSAVDLLGGIDRLIQPGAAVTIVPNFNSDDPFPATTDLAFIREAIHLFRDAGASRIIIGTSSGLSWLPTYKTILKMGLTGLAREMGVELVILDEDEFYEVLIGGKYLHSISIPRTIHESDKLVYLPCMKTHRLAGFTMSLKITMTFPHPADRGAIHTGNLDKKFPEISLAVQPDLILMDGRKAFITGGPDRGRMVEPGVIMASGDMIAIDVEGLRILQTYSADNEIGRNPWELEPIAVAASYGLGARNAGDYRVVGWQDLLCPIT